MFENKAIKAAGSIKAGMEVITADGKRAGYVVGIQGGDLVTRGPVRHLPLKLIRRVSDDVYIALRSGQLPETNAASS